MVIVLINYASLNRGDASKIFSVEYYSKNNNNNDNITNNHIIFK